MAFFTWQPDALLTKDCDRDISQFCLAARPNMANRPGEVGECLAGIVSSTVYSEASHLAKKRDCRGTAFKKSRICSILLVYTHTDCVSTQDGLDVSSTLAACSWIARSARSAQRAGARCWRPLRQELPPPHPTLA
jgi:hypothetical protein